MYLQVIGSNQMIEKKHTVLLHHRLQRLFKWRSITNIANSATPLTEKTRNNLGQQKTAGETPDEDLPCEAVCCHPETSDDLQSPHSFVELKTTDVSPQKKKLERFWAENAWETEVPLGINGPLFQFNEYLWLKFKIFLLGQRNNCMRRAEPINLSELIVRLVALGSPPNFNVSNQSVCSWKMHLIN